MTSLDWHDPSQSPVTDEPAASSGLWFGIAMGLAGIIVGFIIRRMTL